MPAFRSLAFAVALAATCLATVPRSDSRATAAVRGDELCKLPGSACARPPAASGEVPVPAAGQDVPLPREALLTPGRCAGAIEEAASPTRPLESALGQAMKLLSSMERLEAAFDAWAVRSRLQLIENVSRELEAVRQGAACPDAAAEERARLVNFLAGYARLAELAAAMRQAARDEWTFAVAMAALNDACRGCHNTYRPR